MRSEYILPRRHSSSKLTPYPTTEGRQTWTQRRKERRCLLFPSPRRETASETRFPAQRTVRETPLPPKGSTCPAPVQLLTLRASSTEFPSLGRERLEFFTLASIAMDVTFVNVSLTTQLPLMLPLLIPLVFLYQRDETTLLDFFPKSFPRVSAQLRIQGHRKD